MKLTDIIYTITIGKKIEKIVKNTNGVPGPFDYLAFNGLKNEVAHDVVLKGRPIEIYEEFFKNHDLDEYCGNA